VIALSTSPALANRACTPSAAWPSRSKFSIRESAKLSFFAVGTTAEAITRYGIRT
jgi:hypothetical protein